MGGVVVVIELGVDRILFVVGKMLVVLVLFFWKLEEGDDRVLIIGELLLICMVEELGILLIIDEKNFNIFEVVVIGSFIGLVGGFDGVVVNLVIFRIVDVFLVVDDVVVGVCWLGIIIGMVFVDVNIDWYEVIKEIIWDDDNIEIVLDDFVGIIWDENNIVIGVDGFVISNLSCDVIMCVEVIIGILKDEVILLWVGCEDLMVLLLVSFGLMCEVFFVIMEELVSILIIVVEVCFVFFMLISVDDLFVGKEMMWFGC